MKIRIGPLEITMTFSRKRLDNKSGEVWVENSARCIRCGLLTDYRVGGKPLCTVCVAKEKQQ